MSKEEIRKLFVERLNANGLELVSFGDGETWIRGQLVCKNGEIIQ